MTGRLNRPLPPGELFVTNDRTTEQTPSTRWVVCHQWQDDWTDPFHQVSCLSPMTGQLNRPLPPGELFVTNDGTTEQTPSTRWVVCHQWQDDWTDPFHQVSCLSPMTGRLNRPLPPGELFVTNDRTTEQTPSTRWVVCHQWLDDWTDPFHQVSCLSPMTGRLNRPLPPGELFVTNDRTTEQTPSTRWVVCHQWLDDWTDPFHQVSYLSPMTGQLNRPLPPGELFVTNDWTTEQTPSTRWVVCHQWLDDWTDPFHQVSCLSPMTRRLNRPLPPVELFVTNGRMTEQTPSTRWVVCHQRQDDWTDPFHQVSCLSPMTGQLNRPLPPGELFVTNDWMTEQTPSTRWVVCHQWQDDWTDPFHPVSCLSPMAGRLNRPLPPGELFVTNGRTTEQTPSTRWVVCHQWRVDTGRVKTS